MKSTNAKKALCQVCKDAGKTEKEYTSHFVRDKPGPDGVTVCPLLLSLNCRKCGKKGHTFKYCKVNLEKKKEPTRIVEKPNDAPKQKQGKFDSLVESSDEEEEEGEEKEQEPEPEPIKQNKVMTYADKLKAKQLLPLAPTLPDMAVLRSAPTLPDMVALPQAPTLLVQAPALLKAPTLPDMVALPQAPALSQAPTLPRAPRLPVTEEEKEKIQKLKDGCRKIISQKCSWADEDSDTDEDEED
jgi:hypothetical protein